MNRPSSKAEALDLIAMIVVRALKRAEDEARTDAPPARAERGAA